jgi:hypothetical protein
MFQQNHCVTKLFNNQLNNSLLCSFLMILFRRIQAET